MKRDLLACLFAGAAALVACDGGDTSSGSGGGGTSPGDGGGGTGNGGAATTTEGGGGQGGGAQGGSGQGGGGQGGGMVCTPGAVQGCYTGPPGTYGVGLCKGGQRTCDADGAAWGPCEGEVLPAPQQCEVDVDDDCNGAVFDVCQCFVGWFNPCYEGPPGTKFVGACKEGVALCLPDGSAFGVCEGQVLPAPEICDNGVDDDCDGKIDEGCLCAPGAMEACYDGPAWMAGNGPCVLGTRVCAADGDGWGACEGQGSPGVEMCATPEDDDCDGQVNEGCEPCDPGAVEVCYDGPAGSLGQGSCASGTRTCLPDGSDFGPCAGQTLPSAEVCATPADESCDGEAGCGGAILWSKGFPTVDCINGTRVTDIAVDAVGDVLFAGRTCQFAGFGDGPIPATQDSNGFLVKRDAAGEPVWSLHLGDAVTSGQVTAIAVAPNRDVLITGQVYGTLALEGFPPVVTGGNYSVLVARISPEGHVLWRKVYPGAAGGGGRGIAVDGQGNVVLMGETGPTDFGGGVFSTAGGSRDVFVVKLDPEGNPLWAKAFGGPLTERGGGLALDAQGNIGLIAWGGSADFGGGPLVANPGKSAIFVARLDADGNHLWSKMAGDMSPYTVQAIAMSAEGDVVVSGAFYGVFDLGGGPPPLTTGGYITRLAAASGAHLWTRYFVSASAPNHGLDLAFDGADQLLAAGQVSGNVDFGGGVVPGNGFDGFAVKYGTDGVPVWLHRYEVPSGSGEVSAITSNAQGEVLYSVWHNSGVGVGSVLYPSSGDAMVFVKTAP